MDATSGRSSRRDAILYGLSALTAGALANNLTVKSLRGSSNEEPGDHAIPPTKVGHRKTIVDSDFSSLEGALRAAADGDALEVRESWIRDSPWVIDKSVRVRFAGGCIEMSDAAMHGISIVVSDVSIERPELKGAGGDIAGLGAAIYVKGSSGDRLWGVEIRGGNIREWSKYGILAEFVDGFAFREVAIESVAYGAIMVLSCTNGLIENNRVRNVAQPSGFVNSYGIAISHDLSKPAADAPPSGNISIHGNDIDGVPSWEGIDTHGGRNIRITGNNVQNCNVGIAVVGARNRHGEPALAPQRILVDANVIDSGRDDGTRGPGIQVVGASTGPGEAVEYASAIVTNNRIIDHGDQSGTSASGGIALYSTQGTIVANNIIESPGFCGVFVYYDNHSLSVIGNIVTDSWSDDAGYAAVIQIASVGNSMTVTGTTVARGQKSAKTVNSRGLHIRDPKNVIWDGGGNQWHNCALPTAGDAGVTRSRNDAGFNGFFGADPVSKPTITGSRADESKASASLRAALVDLGLVSDSTTA